MECAQVELELVGYLKDELSPNVRQKVRAHLIECAACHQEFLAMGETLRILTHELPPVEPSARFRRDLVAALRRRTAPIFDSGESVLGGTE